MSDSKTAAELSVPGYVSGDWLIDLDHSGVSFIARHLISKVRGRFRTFSGEIHTDPNLLDSSITMQIDAASIDTNNDQRDDHLRSADFLEADTYPVLSFRSTALRHDGRGFVAEGELTIKDVTRPITAQLEPHGFTTDQDGNLRSGYTATFEINRKDYNVNFHWILETGGAMVGDRVTVEVDLEAILRSPRY